MQECFPLEMGDAPCLTESSPDEINSVSVVAGPMFAPLCQFFHGKEITRIFRNQGFPNVRGFAPEAVTLVRQGESSA